MPFGREDRARLQKLVHQLDCIANDLTGLKQITTDLTALKQQVADQQHAIDEARRDANAAINNGLTEIRATVRAGLDRPNELLTGPLVAVDKELAAIRTGISELKTQAEWTGKHDPGGSEDEPPNPPEPPQPRCGPTGPPEPDPDILRAAAGIAHATVQAQRDTWAFLIQVAGNETHFHIPGKVKDDDGFVKVRFSGPSLVAAVTSLHRVAHTTDNPNTRAIAEHVRDKITAAVREVLNNPRSGNTGKPVCIVIDDRPASAGCEPKTGCE
ncbi:hypothetical protein GCM10010145_11660 [Streptomyces ruber]|uniref:Uncharacterized protein n=2 Tax=Streptomyces TaxID=1883 RepID=A0A918B8N7_9ACTN|nr:hypothetical protein GCM10010145_11660 [Streptomyces ruber]